MSAGQLYVGVIWNVEQGILLRTVLCRKYTVSQKTSTFLVFKQLSQKLTDFDDFWCVKSRENLTSIACTVAHLTCIL